MSSRPTRLVSRQFPEPDEPLASVSGRETRHDLPLVPPRTPRQVAGETELERTACLAGHDIDVKDRHQFQLSTAKIRLAKILVCCNGRLRSEGAGWRRLLNPVIALWNLMS